MAEELRVVTIKGTLTTTATQDNIALFINQTGEDISIRKVHLSLSANGLNAGDSSIVELSQDPTVASNVNGDQTKRVIAQVRAPESAAVIAGGHVANTIMSFAKGQWVLEAGEDVHINKSSEATASGTVDCQLWYHIN